MEAWPGIYPSVFSKGEQRGGGSGVTRGLSQGGSLATVWVYNN